jgi:hypothetical protein
VIPPQRGRGPGVSCVLSWGFCKGPPSFRLWGQLGRVGCYRTRCGTHNFLPPGRHVGRETIEGVTGSPNLILTSAGRRKSRLEHPRRRRRHRNPHSGVKGESDWLPYEAAPTSGARCFSTRHCRAVSITGGGRQENPRFVESGRPWAAGKLLVSRPLGTSPIPPNPRLHVSIGRPLIVTTTVQAAECFSTGHRQAVSQRSETARQHSR